MRRVDLNLLNALDALIAARSVSGAAERLGVGQPAMSASLKRLREMFGDPLLVRGPRGMEPTERGLALAEQVQQSLGELKRLYDPPASFDPATAQRTFRISGGDYLGMVLFPALIAAVQAQAPQIDLRFRFVEKGQLYRCLDEDEIDVALAVLSAAPPRFEIRPIFSEQFVCVARAGHPALAAPLTAASYAAQNHVLVTERGDDRGVVDETLAGLGLYRRVAVTVPLTALAAQVLEQSHAIATLGGRAAALLARSGKLTVGAVPIALAPWEVSMIWPRRKAQSRGLAWLRALIAGLAEQI